MTIKTNLLTTAAILALSAGSAMAENHVEATDMSSERATEAPGGTAYAPGWNADLDSRYAELADRQVAELIGMTVITEGGEDVGEIDNFVLMENQLKAVVGVGGFLGLGEHDVALSLSDLQYDGERMIVAFTEEELETMPQYTAELDQVVLGETDTFRTRGDMESAADANSEMAATQLETDRNSEDVAAGGELAVENDADAELAVEESTTDAEVMTENVAEATERGLESAGEEVAQAAEETGDAIAEGAENTQEMASEAGAAVGNWFEQLEAEFAELADAEISEIEGKEVVSAEGQVIGEIGSLGMQNETPVAIVGVGGFLGLGDHDVALDLTQLGWNGEAFVLEGYTETELREMPQVDPASVEMLDSTTTLRSHASM